MGTSFISRLFNLGFLVKGPRFTVSRLSMVEEVDKLSTTPDSDWKLDRKI